MCFTLSTYSQGIFYIRKFEQSIKELQVYYSTSDSNNNTNNINKIQPLSYEKKNELQQELKKALAKEDVEEMKKLKEIGADINGSIGDYTPLCVAVKSKNMKMVEEILKMGADINKCSSTGNKAISFAVINNDFEMVEKLQKEGASLDTYLKVGRLEENVWDMIGLGFDYEHAKQYSLLHIAAENGSVKMIQYLVNCGCHLENMDYNMATPIFASVEKNNLECVKELIKLGANVNAEDEDGNTPLQLASSLGFTEVCIFFFLFLLLKKYLFVIIIDSKGITVAWWRGCT